MQCTCSRTLQGVCLPSLNVALVAHASGSGFVVNQACVCVGGGGGAWTVIKESVLYTLCCDRKPTCTESLNEEAVSAWDILTSD